MVCIKDVHKNRERAPSHKHIQSSSGRNESLLAINCEPAKSPNNPYWSQMIPTDPWWTRMTPSDPNDPYENNKKPKVAPNVVSFHNCIFTIFKIIKKHHCVYSNWKVMVCLKERAHKNCGRTHFT